MENAVRAVGLGSVPLVSLGSASLWGCRLSITNTPGSPRGCETRGKRERNHPTEDGGSGSRVGWSSAHPILTASPLQTRPGSRAALRGLCPKPRSSSGGIRGDKQAEKCSSTCAELLPAWPHGAAMSRGAGAGLGAASIPGCHRVTGVGVTPLSTYHGGMRTCPDFLKQQLSGQSFSMNL